MLLINIYSMKTRFYPADHTASTITMSPPEVFQVPKAGTGTDTHLQPAGELTPPREGHWARVLLQHPTASSQNRGWITVWPMRDFSEAKLIFCCSITTAELIFLIYFCTLKSPLKYLKAYMMRGELHLRCSDPRRLQNHSNFVKGSIIKASSTTFHTLPMKKLLKGAMGTEGRLLGPAEHDARSITYTHPSGICKSHSMTAIA